MERASFVENVGQVSPRAIKNIVLCVTFLVLAATAIALRIWARKIKGSFLCFNDYAILAALVRDNHSKREINSANAPSGKLFEVGDSVTILTC